MTDLLLTSPYQTKVTIEPDGRLVMAQSRPHGGADVVILDGAAARELAEAILFSEKQKPGVAARLSINP